MELGFFVGRGNELGQPIPIGEAEEHIFGMCLVNDWSARDIQSWEYQPLGPFLAKNFATTISPFVVTMEALAPFRTKAFERPEGDPRPLDYLADDHNQKFGGLDINLEVYIQTEKMRNENIEPHLLSRSNTKDLYWTVGQMLTHHASNGCNLQTGDLIASGTVSGKEKSERGCMLELTWRGTEPIDLPGRDVRQFDALEPLARSPPRLVARQPLERSEVGHDVDDVELGVEAAFFGEVAKTIEMLAASKLAEHTNLAGIGPDDVHQDANERALAGAVRSK